MQETDIQIIKECSFKIPNVMVPMEPATIDEVKDPKEKIEDAPFDRKKVDAVLVPLIFINGIYIKSDLIQRFILESDSLLPEFELTFTDDKELFKQLSIPGSNNEVILVITSDFDKVYKKIKMMFYITSSSIIGSNTIKVSCTYKAPNLHNAQIQCFPKVGIYKFLKDNITSICPFGFATNLKGIDDTPDKQIRFLDGKSVVDVLRRDIGFSGSTEKDVYVVFVDFWNNLTLIDKYKQLNTKTKDQVATMRVLKDVVDQRALQETKEVPLYLTNLNQAASTPVYISNYNIISSPGSAITKGSNKSVCYVDNNTNIKTFNNTTIIQSDIKEEVRKYTYGGRYFSDTNYLQQRSFRESFEQKVSTVELEIITDKPNLAIMRGSNIDIMIFNYNATHKEIMASREGDIKNRDVDIKTDLENQENSNIPTVNKALSGQYFVKEIKLKYNNGSFQEIYKVQRISEPDNYIIDGTLFKDNGEL